MSYIPTREADLVAWSNNFNTLINVDPTVYGLTLAQASGFDALNTAWVNAYDAAVNPATRGPSTKIAKDNAKDAMVENARDLAAIIQAHPGVTDQQKFDLGLTVRDVEPTPVPVPSAAPTILFPEPATGNTIHIRLRDAENPENRGKPAGVIGASVFTYIGDTPPAGTEAWTFRGNSTRTRIDIDLPLTIAPATKVWITAYWFNTRADSGPAAAPVYAFTAPGLSQAA